MSPALPKPPKRAPKARKRIPRKARPRPLSQRPSAVERRQKDAAWAGAVRERAKGWCEWCAWNGRSHVWREAGSDAHHVLTKKAHPHLRHILENGIYLSRFCHRLAHAYPKSFREWFGRAFPARWAALQARLKEETA